MKRDGENSKGHARNPFALIKAVFWSFFGVRKSQDHDADITRITPLGAILGGVIGALLVITLLVIIVNVVIYALGA